MKKLASYFNVSLSAAYKWSAETVRRKTVIMQSGAEPEIIKLIGEISQLCYVFDCKHVVGAELTAHASINVNADSAYFLIIKDGETVDSQLIALNINTSTAVAELQKVKSTLESFVYGGA
jgi:hypothetical protein